MEVIIFIFSFTFGLAFGLFVYAQMLLPILYGLPRAIWLFIRGELRFMGIITQLIAPLIWFIFFVVLGFIFQAVYPPAVEYLTTNTGFSLGQLLAIAWLIFNFLSSRGRKDMREDFMQTTYRKYGKYTNEFLTPQYRILMLQNDAFLSEMYKIKFKTTHFDFISWTEPPLDYIQKIVEVKPNLILLGIILPQVDGFTIIQNVKNDPRTKDIPIVFFTNLTQEDDIKKGMALGATDYLVMARLTPDQVIEKCYSYLAVQNQ